MVSKAENPKSNGTRPEKQVEPAPRKQAQGQEQEQAQAEHGSAAPERKEGTSLGKDEARVDQAAKKGPRQKATSTASSPPVNPKNPDFTKTFILDNGEERVVCTPAFKEVPIEGSDKTRRVMARDYDPRCDPGEGDEVAPGITLGH